MWMPHFLRIFDDFCIFPETLFELFCIYQTNPTHNNTKFLSMLLFDLAGVYVLL